MLDAYRRAGESLVMTIPKAFVEQNGLGVGSLVELRLKGPLMTVSVPKRPRYSLSKLLAEMPEDLPEMEGGYQPWKK